VIELYADIGGFLGIGATRVIVQEPKFSFGDNEVVLSMSKEETQRLPRVDEKSEKDQVK
jgi:hypothetical protein